MNADATNQWLWRFNIRRLDFEEVRDTLLALELNENLERYGSLRWYDGRLRDYFLSVGTVASNSIRIPHRP